MTDQRRQDNTIPPRRPRRGPCPGPRRAGVSLIEVCITLSLTATLLVAVATAFNSSAEAVEHNEQFFRATQAGRVTMNQLLTEIRRADYVEVSTNTIDVVRPAETADAGEDYRRFAYNAETDQITLQVFYTDGTASPVYTVARDVISATLGPAEAGTDADGNNVVARVPITLKVRVGSNTVTLNGSAGPRRALPR